MPGASTFGFRDEITREQRDVVIACAMGRIFRLGSRPTQPGDVEEYERCRRVILECADELGPDWDKRPNYAASFPVTPRK